MDENKRNYILTTERYRIREKPTALPQTSHPPTKSVITFHNSSYNRSRHIGVVEVDRGIKRLHPTTDQCL